MILFLVIPQSIENIELDEILYVKKHANSSKIYLKSGVCHQSDISFENHLSSLAEGFTRIHHSYIVNLKNVTNYYKLGEVKMVNGKRLPVSRNRKLEVKAKWNKTN